MPTFALIPAAGKSTRMGRPKLQLPLGNATVLERVVASVRSAGVHDVLVVVPPHGDDLARLARTAGAHALRLDHDTADMRGTCQAGLRWLQKHARPSDDDGWLLLPADHPTLQPDVIHALLNATATHPEASIFVPTWEGRRGHPIWLRWTHVEAILALPEGQGLNHYIRAQSGATCEVPWASDEVLRDLDTPEDYRRLLESF